MSYRVSQFKTSPFFIMQWFKNLPISKKLLFGFAFVAFFAGVSGFAGTSSILRVDNRYSSLQKSATAPLASLAEISKLLQRERINLRDMVLAESAAEMQIYIDRLAKIRIDIDSLQKEYGKTDLDETDLANYETFVNALTRYAPISRELEQLAYNGNKQVAHDLLRGDAFTSVKEVENALDNMVITKKINAELISLENTAITRQSTILQIVLLVISVAAAIWLGLVLSRLIGQPVRELERAAKRVAEGDLDATVHFTMNDELGKLGTSFNMMVSTIHNALEDVNKEKADVERKVDEAVRQSDAQRQYLASSVDEMLQAMNKFAEGDLTIALHIKKEDEIGSLYRGFNRAVVNMNQMICQVGTAAQAAANAATEISSSSIQLSESAQTQSIQSSDVAAAVEEMVLTIIDNSRNATRTAEVASENGEVAREGGAVVEQTVEKIRQIANVVNDSAATVEHLGTSSQQIGEIAQVIDEIADQTNLLALNAAIEAARAGEQGRGFAVVADEVRKLAERTTKATTEIAQMIHTIQEGAKRAVEAMQRGSSEVGEGIRLADQAGEALSRVVSGTAGTVDMVSQIAAASEEQSATSEQISLSVERISKISVEAANGIRQITVSTESLNNLTAELNQLVSQFRVHQDSTIQHNRTELIPS